MSLEAAERSVREGDLEAALRLLQEQIRSQPGKSDLRVFLFQLLCVMGQWDRALTQLNVAADLDAKTLAMAQMYREAIRCELVRADVFAGKKSPLVFGEPDQWVALLIESTLEHGRSRARESQALRDRAFEAAPATSGAIDGEPFEWIADADMRLGPVCEAVINGRYYWVPFERLAKIDLEEPADLRDVVWMPAHFEFANGGDAVGVIPARYPGSEGADEAAVRLGRKTVWDEQAPGVFSGSGQRVLTTDVAEHALMDVRKIRFGAAAVAQSQDAADA